MVAEESVTVWPEEIDVESRLMSLPDVPTVSPVRLAVPPLFLILAAAAVPDAEAVTLAAENASVQTSFEIVPPPAVRVKVASTAAIPDVPISSVPPAK